MGILETIVAEYANRVDMQPNSSCVQDNCCACLHNQYFNGSEITYDCKDKQALYVARYFPVHVKEVMLALQIIPVVVQEKFYASSLLKVACLGGGPGSDVVAVQEWLTNHRGAGWINNMEARFLRLDINEKWNDVANKICCYYQSDSSLKFDHWILNCDVTKAPEIGGKNKGTNLFTLSYLVSEIEDDKIASLADVIIRMADKTRSVLLINDRQEQKIINRIGKLLSLLPGRETSEDKSACNCGVDYSSEHKAKVKPKLTTSSIRYVRVLHDN